MKTSAKVGDFRQKQAKNSTSHRDIDKAGMPTFVFGVSSIESIEGDSSLLQCMRDFI